MTDYIPIDEIPHRRHATQYPYAEWRDRFDADSSSERKIPGGMALEITGLMTGKKVSTCRTLIAQYLKYHDLPLVVLMRNERLFIVRKAEAPTKERVR